jgi:hypothetical protein
MKNTTLQIQIIKDKDTNELIGYMLPGETCVLSAKFLRSKKIGIPAERDNVIFV